MDVDILAADILHNSWRVRLSSLIKNCTLIKMKVALASLYDYCNLRQYVVHSYFMVVDIHPLI
jgi:hypothetical protein